MVETKPTVNDRRAAIDTGTDVHIGNKTALHKTKIDPEELEEGPGGWTRDGINCMLKIGT